MAEKYLGPIEKKINDLGEKDLNVIRQHRKNVAVKYLPEDKM